MSRQVVSLTIGPAFFSAAIYLCLARIVVVFGTHLSRFQPRVYTITFMIFDFLALVLQASGGSLLGSDNPSTMDTGLKVMQAGLSIHLIAIVAFIILAGEFAYRVLRPSKPWDATFSDLQTSKRFRHFLIGECECNVFNQKDLRDGVLTSLVVINAGTTVSTACILVRTAYRVAELSSGLHSDIANNEAALMVFEGAMVLIAAACLAVYHPGVAFEGRWDEANFELSEGEKEKELELA